MPVLLQLFQSLGGGVANLIRQISSEGGASRSYVGLFDTSDFDTTPFPLNKVQIGPPDARTRIFSGWLKRHRDLKAAKRRLGVTVTISHSPWLHALNIFSGGYDRKIIVIHGTVTSRRTTFVELFLFRIFFFLFDGATHSYVAVSEELKLETLRWVKDPGKVICVVNAVDPDEIISKSGSPLSPPMEVFLNGNKFLVSVGRLHPQKNFDFLIRLFARLKKSEAYAAYKLVLIGDGNHLKSLTATAQAAGLAVAVPDSEAASIAPTADVLFTGYLENPFPIVKRAQAYLSTSLYEGYAFAVCEAMILNKLLILSDCPTGHVEIVSGSYSEEYKLGPNKYGTLLPMRNAPALEALSAWEQYLLANTPELGAAHGNRPATNPDIYQNKNRQLSKWKAVISGN